MTKVTVLGLPGGKAALVEIDPGIKLHLQAATRAAAFAVKPFVVRQTAPVSKRMAAEIKVKPGKVKPSTAITFGTWFAHFVVQGTRDHGPRRRRVLRWTTGPITHFARRVRGAPSHPILETAAAAGRTASDAAFIKALTPKGSR